jgi:hypothetical protein
MLNRCVSCGAPAPANRSDFHFTCEFCGTKNVDEEYLKEKAKSIESKTGNNAFESALMAIEAGDFEKATGLIDEALKQDNNNQEILIFHAYCHAALTKPSNFEKNFKVAEISLNKAKNLGDTEVFTLGKTQVSNMFLDRAESAGNYFFDTAEKKLIAFGDNQSTRQSFLDETLKGINLFEKTIELNPTEKEKKIKILVTAIDKIHSFSGSESSSQEYTNKKKYFFEKLFEIYKDNKEVVENIVNRLPEKKLGDFGVRSNANLILKTLRSMGAPKVERKSDSKSESTGDTTSKTWVYVAVGAVVVVVGLSLLGKKNDSNQVVEKSKSSAIEEKKSPSNNMLGKNAFEFFSDSKAMQLFLTAVGEKNVDEAKNYFMVSSPSTKDGNWIIAEGCMPRSCGSEDGIILMDMDSTKMIVAIYEKSKNNTALFNSMGLPIKQIDGFYTLNTQTPQKLKDWLRERGSNFRD